MMPQENKIYCRLDYWFVVEHLANVMKQTNILPSIRPDHNIIGMTLTNITSMTPGIGNLIPRFYVTQITLI